MENWRSVEGYEHYEVSDLGQVRTKGHRVLRNNGYAQLTAKVMKQRINASGYCVINLTDANKKQKKHLVSRLVANAFIGDVSGKVVNHLSKNTQDNSIANLEICSARENTAHGSIGRGTSKFVGVSADRGKWRSSIMIKGKNVYLGRHNCEMDAARAYVNACETYGIENKYAVALIHL